MWFLPDKLFCLLELKKLPWPNGLSLGSSSTLVVYTLIILDTLRVKISIKHESEQTLGNKLYPIWLPSFGIIFLLI